MWGHWQHYRSLRWLQLLRATCRQGACCEVASDPHSTGAARFSVAPREASHAYHALLLQAAASSNPFQSAKTKLISDMRKAGQPYNAAYLNSQQQQQGGAGAGLGPPARQGLLRPGGGGGRTLGGRRPLTASGGRTFGGWARRVTVLQLLWG